MICFFDTNVLVYCMDAGDPLRQARAIERLEQASAQGKVVLSAQVLQEFYAITTRKLCPALSPAEQGWVTAAMKTATDLVVLT